LKTVKVKDFDGVAFHTAKSENLCEKVVVASAAFSQLCLGTIQPAEQH
jgi:hypothetical protein